MTRVLFLDVDGVLNTNAARGLDSRMLDMVAVLCARSQCSVVVSSTWRKYPHMRARLWPELEKRSITILDSTPELHSFNGTVWTDGTRGQEISAWLKRFPSNCHYVVLDDADVPEHANHLVRVNADTGLTIPDINRAMVFFLEQKSNN